MQNAQRFVGKFANSIVTTLSCVDRLIFKGHLPLGGDEQLNQFVDRLGIRRKDFLPQLEPLSERLVEHAKSAAAEADAPYHYLQGQHSKEKLIDQTIRERKPTSGLIAVLCCLESCRTIKLRYGDGQPRLAFTRRPQRVLYYYFLDPEFGRVHVRIETWFPFTIQIYVNGHDWLTQQLAQRQAGFVQRDNCFTELDDPAAAQRQTVINNPRECKIRRWRNRHGRRQRVWCPMNKGIANLYQYRAAAQAANVRYLEALSVVNDPTPADQQVATLVQPKQAGPRSYAGFNPARREDIQFFRAVLRGEHELRGFRNADLRRLLHQDDRDPEQRRRNRAAIGRRLKRLHVRGLVAKIPHTRRWKVTPRGRRTIGVCVQLYYHGLDIAA